MKIIIKFFPCALLVTSFSLYPLSYDNAAYAAQKGKWKDAHEKLNSILVDAPDRADVLYDAGVAAYNLNNFNEAAACFARAAGCADDNYLRARAHFNAGNALVEHKDLLGALEQYEKVLALDSTHEYARHNRDRVKQMLEEQQNKEQQDQQDDEQKKDEQKNDDHKDDDQKEDQKDQQDKQDKNNGQQDKQNQSKNDKKDQQGNDDQQEQGNDEGSNKESQGDQGNQTKGGSKDTQRKDHGNKKEEQKNSANDQKRDGDQKSQEESHGKNKKGDTKNGDKHKETPEKQLNGSDNGSVASEEGQEQESLGNESEDKLADLQKSFEQKINDKWLLSVLNNQEERDKVINKKLMEAKINQHGGKDGQNCW